MRLRSRRFVTSRLRYSTSRSMASTLSRWSSGLRPRAGPQGAGRGPDGGQRRAQVVRDGLQQGRLQGVALARDLGRLRDSAASRSCATAWPTWSAAEASRRVSVGVGLAAAALTRGPDRALRPRRPPRCGPGRRPRSADACTRARGLVDAHPAERLVPARGARSAAGRGRGRGRSAADVASVSATVRSLAPSAPSVIQTRDMAACGRSTSATDGQAGLRSSRASRGRG